MTLNEKGATVRCHACGKLTKSVYPCKVCGSVKHIVAIVRTRWTNPAESIVDVMKRSRLKAIKQWNKQAGFGGRGRKPWHPDTETSRGTVIFDFDDSVITTTFYLRYREVRYPE